MVAFLCDAVNMNGNFPCHFSVFAIYSSWKLVKLSIRYKEVVELADVLDCDIVWMKRGARR